MASVTFPPALGGDGSTVTDDANVTTGLANGGHRARFVPALSQSVAVMSGAVQQTGDDVTAAEASAVAAAASAASAVASPGTNATSTTSLAIGTGSKTLTIQTAKSLVVGMTVKIASTASPTNWMAGDITAYNSGTGSLTVNVLIINGSGTLAAWTVSLSGAVNNLMVQKTGDTMTGALNWASFVTVASAGTTDIGAATSNVVNITGATTITSLGTIAAGAERTLIFAGVLTLTHNATSLILPSAANILTSAGDTAQVVSLGSGNWKCVGYQRASGKSVGGGAPFDDLTSLAQAHAISLSF